MISDFRGPRLKLTVKFDWLRLIKKLRHIIARNKAEVEQDSTAVIMRASNSEVEKRLLFKAIGNKLQHL